jgi:hypothetical protein
LLVSEYLSKDLHWFPRKPFTEQEQEEEQEKKLIGALSSNYSSTAHFKLILWS